MIKEKKYYDVRQEIIAPVTLYYKVFAESPEEAAEMVKKRQVLVRSSSQPNLKKMIIREISVFISGTINKVFYKKM